MTYVQAVKHDLLRITYYATYYEHCRLLSNYYCNSAQLTIMTVSLALFILLLLFIGITIYIYYITIYIYIIVYLFYTIYRLSLFLADIFVLLYIHSCFFLIILSPGECFIRRLLIDDYLLLITIYIYIYIYIRMFINSYDFSDFFLIF